MSTDRLDDAALDAMVARLLANDDINLGFVPDAVEAKLYRNILRLGLGLVKEAANTVELSLLGHTLTLSLKPATSFPGPTQT